MKKRTVALLMAAVLLFGAAVGGTLALLTAKTDSITNTFTAGNVAITLTETGATNNAKSFKMIPGEALTKDPKITVLADSEECYVFVKVEASADAADYIDYDMAEGWAKLDGVDNVWYKETTVALSDENQEIGVLANDKVTVLDTVTSDDMTAVTEGDAVVTLTFTAYAVQAAGNASAAAAWTAANFS